VADEVLSAISTSDALRQAEILAMRQLSDNLGVLNRTVERLGADVRETRDKVIQMEAQELKATVISVKSDIDKAVTALRDDHDRRIEKTETRLSDAEGKLNRLQGLLLPLSVIATSMLSGALAFGSAYLLHR
jgi:chromosome segregation ATPase